MRSQLQPLFLPSHYYLRSGPSEMYPRSLYGEEELTEAVTIIFGTKSLQFPIVATDISKVSELVESCVPSGFGVNGRTVIDSSYRNCKELKPKDFAISNNYHEILPKIVTQAANILESPKPIYASLNKLCVYETHGFFKEHVDTPKANIFASLVVCLPTSYEGGKLIVENDSYDLSSANSIKWCAFYSDCKHKINEVTKGFRVTLTYDLLYLEVSAPTSCRDHLYKTLEKSLLKLHSQHHVDPAHSSSRKPKFVIGIPLASKYPSISNRDSGVIQKTKPILKGRDLKILTALHDLGYTTDIKAVYSVELEKLSDNWYEALPAFDGVGDIYEEEDFTEVDYGGEVYVISDVWNGWAGEVDEQFEDNPLSGLYQFGGRCISNLVWLSEPRCQHAAASYLAYGNEASTGIVYMDGCILAYK
ncbi:hypothetical protein BGX27_005517 [Mortierella sp. AM989]|nr:hypothetical protein BGX27_005517 [Mortierella sp. AM989]